MFDTEIDIKLIISTCSALVVLTTAIGSIIGFSIKKLMHIAKGG